MGLLMSGNVMAQVFQISGDGNPLNSINGHYWVDLGLSVRWSTRNIGASSYDKPGDYYAWGETSVKETYTQENCKTNSVTFDIQGNPNYDPAAAKWGNGWRMPTIDEIVELVLNCDWTWICTEKYLGALGVSKKNGESIFLPVAGYMINSKTVDNVLAGCYWSANHDFKYFDNQAKGLTFISTAIATYHGPKDKEVAFNDPEFQKCCGLLIRPVIDKD